MRTRMQSPNMLRDRLSSSYDIACARSLIVFAYDRGHFEPAIGQIIQKLGRNTADN
jgi:hypothetical protein